MGQQYGGVFLCKAVTMMRYGCTQNVYYIIWDVSEWMSTCWRGCESEHWLLQLVDSVVARPMGLLYGGVIFVQGNDHDRISVHMNISYTISNVSECIRTWWHEFE